MNNHDVDMERKKLLAVALKRQRELLIAECFDANDLDSRPNKKQTIILKDIDSLHIYIRAGNQSGKSQTKIRDYAWKLQENHPYWRRRVSKQCHHYTCESKNISKVDPDPQSKLLQCNECHRKWIPWDNEPLVFLCVVQDASKHIPDIWDNRLKKLLPEGSYDTKHSDGSLSYITMKKTGNRLYFFSHNNPTQLKKSIQYFAAHDVWIDEMPSDPNIMEEMQRRVDAKQGQFSATFTQKIINNKVKKFVDNADPSIATVHRMSKFDNPIYKGREEVEMAKLGNISEARKKAILFGDWLSSESQKFAYDAEKLVHPLPMHYSKMWEHVAVIDPAASGKTGFGILGKDPEDIQKWYLIVSRYIPGKAPTKLLADIRQEMINYNIVRKIYDPHETWFAKEAEESGESWIGVYNKSQRKLELIGEAQNCLDADWFKVAGKMEGPIYHGENEDFINELDEAEEDPAKEGHIRNSTKYHLLDMWQYFIDCKPIYQEKPPEKSRATELREKWNEQRIFLAQKKDSGFEEKPGGSNTWAGKRKRQLWSRGSSRRKLSCSRF